MGLASDSWTRWAWKERALASWEYWEAAVNAALVLDLGVVVLVMRQMDHRAGPRLKSTLGHHCLRVHHAPLPPPKEKFILDGGLNAWSFAS